MSHESPGRTSARSDLQPGAGRRVLAGSAVGIAFGSVPFFTAGFPVLAAAWKAGEGWTDASIARAASGFLLMQIIAAPLTGALLDRFGTRRVASVSIVLFALALLGLAHDRSQAGLVLVFGLMGLTTAGTNVIAYARAIALHFDRRRGLSLGFASAAQAVGVIIIPNLARLLAARHGWRLVPETLAVVELVLCLPAVGLLVRGGAAPLARTETGSFGAILGSGRFALLAAGAFFQGFALYAILPNLALVVSQAHLSAPLLALCTSAAGVCFLVGRLATGALLDRFEARLVGPAIAGVLACSLLCFAGAHSAPAAFAGGCLMGLAGGGETDLLPYAASRYFGGDRVGRSYGALLVTFFAGAAAGPVGFVAAASALGVASALAALACLQVLPALLLRFLPAYPGRAAEPEVRPAA